MCIVYVYVYYVYVYVYVYVCYYVYVSCVWQMCCISVHIFDIYTLWVKK